MKEDVHDYTDILAIEHNDSKKHKRMSMTDRAAQFSPFAALTGYEDSIRETGRETTEKKILSEERREEINRMIHYLLDNKETEFNITYFIKDEKKEGGRYQEDIATLKKYIEEESSLLLSSGTKINLEDIYDISLSDGHSSSKME